jgi:hypothetical protein
MPHLCLYEKAREVHYHVLRHELQERRLLTRLPKQWSISTRTVGKLGVLLLKLGTWLKATRAISYRGRRWSMSRRRRVRLSRRKCAAPL